MIAKHVGAPSSTAALTSTPTSSRVLELPPPHGAAPIQPRPLTGKERLALVDVLRGVAILGVLIAYTLWNLGGPPENTWSRADRVIDMLGSYLVDSKFI